MKYFLVENTKLFVVGVGSVVNNATSVALLGAMSTFTLDVLMFLSQHNRRI